MSPSRSPDQHGGRHWLARLRNWLLTGLAVTGPLAITVYLVWWVVQWADGWIVPYIPAAYNPNTYLPFEVPGVGILIGALVITLIGFLTANLLGRQVVALGERLMRRLPLVRNLYIAVKQMVETIFSERGGVFGRAVLIEYPRKGSWAIALVAPEAAAEVEARLAGSRGGTVSLFVPTTPNPTTGFLTYVARQDMVPLEMTIEQALKTIISAGLVAPEARPVSGEAKPYSAASSAGAEPSSASVSLAAAGPPAKSSGSAEVPSKPPTPADRA